jgi:hypothetical protein
VCLHVDQTRSRSSKRNDVLERVDSRKEKGNEGKMCSRERQGSVLNFGGEGEAQIDGERLHSGELAQGAGMPCPVQTNNSRQCS